jgi:hypothetical protein
MEFALFPSLCSRPSISENGAETMAELTLANVTNLTKKKIGYILMKIK